MKKVVLLLQKIWVFIRHMFCKAKDKVQFSDVDGDGDIDIVIINQSVKVEPNDRTLNNMLKEAKHEKEK